MQHNDSDDLYLFSDLPAARFCPAAGMNRIRTIFNRQRPPVKRFRGHADLSEWYLRHKTVVLIGHPEEDAPIDLIHGCRGGYKGPNQL
jgi:hypothetical protein